ncbi:ATP-binding protein [Leptospira harrisiae]|uniref:ATP-binding protein n=1 Tax=Leptospira harrisiae TaxID=2023189 RepID=UPI000C2A37F6|nr:ATP-binding protein [Leptospira harrisiae]PKA06383.1 hypothetical protein CH366_19390 [Leptospira harrisiae]
MKRLSKSELIELLREEESTYLDFKEFHSENFIDLIHDILCLANAPGEVDRYLIYGVSDGKIIKGIQNKHKTQADISDSIRSSNFNRIPEFLFYSITINSFKIDILQLKNSKHKPFFLLKDKSYKGRTIRAGVIYSRYNDSNTPIDSTASEIEIAEMWQERFGILKTPLERSLQYVLDIPNWISSSEDEFYYSKFPEFKLTLDSVEPRDHLLEHWVDINNPCEISATTIKIFYHTTLLKLMNGINLENRIYLPNPRYYDQENRRTDGKAYIIEKNIESYINAILSGTQKISEYDKEFIAENKIKSEIDVYTTELTINIAIYGLKIQIEKENINKHYSYRDLL